MVNDGSPRYLQIERVLRERTQRLLLKLPPDLRKVSEKMGEVSLIIDAFAYITQPKFAEHRDAHLFLLHRGLRTKFERDVFTDFWLRQGNRAKSWLPFHHCARATFKPAPISISPADALRSNLALAGHASDMPIFIHAMLIFPPHIRSPPPKWQVEGPLALATAAALWHPVASDMQLLFIVAELGWVRREPCPVKGLLGPSYEAVITRTLRRRIRERQNARLASGDVDGLV